MSDFDGLLRLPVEEQEQRWLRERLATLSVRESVTLTAAILRTQPQNTVDAINCLQSLDHYTVRFNAGSYEALGHSWLRNDTRMPPSALPFVDLEQTGRYYTREQKNLPKNHAATGVDGDKAKVFWHTERSPSNS